MIESASSKKKLCKIFKPTNSHLINLFQGKSHPLPTVFDILGRILFTILLLLLSLTANVFREHISFQTLVILAVRLPKLIQAGIMQLL